MKKKNASFLCNARAHDACLSVRNISLLNVRKMQHFSLFLCFECVSTATKKVKKKEKKASRLLTLYFFLLGGLPRKISII
jgi:hypothetical protein